MQPTIEIEFSRYRTIVKMMDLFTIPDNFKDTYENLNILERWLLTGANDVQAGEDPFFAERKLQADYIYTAKMLDEFKEKGIKNYEKYYEKFIEYAREWLNRDTSADVTPKVYVLESIMRIYDSTLSYYYAFPKELYKFYTDRASPTELAIICLRYACTLQQAQHWAMPYELYSVIFGHYGAEVEGFASPLNTQIMKYNPNGKFCSLFYDTDKPMGSIGSFFTHDYIGKTIMAGPPYIDFIYDKILDLILDHMDRSEKENIPMRFFVSISGWHDCKLAMSLDKHKFTRKKYVTQANETYFIDTKLDTYVAFSPRNFVYIVSNGYPDENYDKMDEAFENIERTTLRLVKLNADIKKLKPGNVVDLTHLVKKRSYRNIKQCFDYLHTSHRIPKDVAAIFDAIPSNQRAISMGVIARAAYSIPGLKFPWSVIKQKCQAFIDNISSQTY